MKRFYKILRALLVSVILLGLVVPALLYVLLSLPFVQDFIRDKAQVELTRLLGVEVKIGDVDISPFNRAMLSDVTLLAAPGDTIASIDRLGAGVNVSQLLLHGNIVVTYAELIGMDLRVKRDTPDSPLNIQPIIDALSSKDKNKPPTPFDFKVNTVLIRRSYASYDVLSEPRQPGRFDASHIKVNDLRADISLPRMTNDNFTVDVLHLVFSEQSGLNVKNFSGRYHVTATGATARNPVIELPRSVIKLEDIDLSYSSFASIADDLKRNELHIALRPGSYVTPSDLSAFAPMLADLGDPMFVDLDITGTPDDLDISTFKASAPFVPMELDTSGKITGLLSRENFKVEFPSLSFTASGRNADNLLARFIASGSNVRRALTTAGDLSLEASVYYTPEEAKLTGNISTDVGALDFNADYTKISSTDSRLNGHISGTDISCGEILSREDIGNLSFDADIEAVIGSKIKSASFNGVISNLGYNSHDFTGITADVKYDGTTCLGEIDIDDPEARMKASGSIALDREIPVLDLAVEASGVNLALLGLEKKHPDRRFSIDAKASLNGKSINDAVGSLEIESVAYVDPSGKGIMLDDIVAYADNRSVPQLMTLSSEYVDGRIEGVYDMAKIPSIAKGILSQIFPALIPGKSEIFNENDALANLDFSFTLHPNQRLCQMVMMPLKIVEDVDIAGRLDSGANQFEFALNAPYLFQNEMMLRNTALNVELDGNADRAALYLTSTAHVRKEDITFTLQSYGSDNTLETDISWDYHRPKRYDGNINFTTAVSRDHDNKLQADIDVNHSVFMVNDTLWTVHPATIKAQPGLVTVKDLVIDREGQRFSIYGAASPDPADEIVITLEDIDLDYVFNSLAIESIMFGGIANGELRASSLFSGAPVLATEGIDIKRMTYNGALMGDAILKSSWDNTDRSVIIDAVINQYNGRQSTIYGKIFPMSQELDFNFHADHANAAFMKPFMKAFAADVEGEGTGDVHMWGTFHLLDLDGDIFADKLRLKLAFTNTWYSASDSVHLSPGLIKLSNVELTDDFGNHAMLNGWVSHEYLSHARFDFTISDARHLLVYDMPQGLRPDEFWYGKVFGDGNASIKGDDDGVDININLTTSPGSVFNYVLSKTENAGEYTFLSFRDVGKKDNLDIIVKPEPAEVIALREKEAAGNKTSSAPYNIDINVNVTPQTQVVLVMDPVGGDRIKANGSGNLHLIYSSASEDLFIYGNYVLDRGSYNFTLQDIIVKDFTIKSGSSIKFNGDPYSAQLDIKAEYVVNANLSDLDESFLQDKDLNRTNVPVHAQLLITGDMRQPEIDFDLSIPTLNSDVDRKVKSIVSTKEMMNQQIVYLLTLSRFYTPDYMISATKGNEFVSMASSTLSSQLGSMLREISDYWTIAPAVRSDKGDFSDVEFDLVLSSTLLNNRLLLNGNLGYRDNALNNNSFIGDFDIEYLLNRQGTIRLKAYNRYNDQNYYVRPALTTQGVGVVFRHDFDNPFDFLKRKPRKVTAPVDSVAPRDTITN